MAHVIFTVKRKYFTVLFCILFEYRSINKVCHLGILIGWVSLYVLMDYRGEILAVIFFGNGSRKVLNISSVDKLGSPSSFFMYRCND